jgi:SAM-dependent methyltransferase
MPIDIRVEAASYYDLNPNTPNDVPFYKGKIPSPATHVLELGCGTGRVLLPLAECCDYVHGLDRSDAMLALCRQKLQQAGISSRKAKVEVGDITDFDLGRRCDHIIAPYRVFQNLETTTQVAGLFRCIRQYLSPAGTCILNVFKPRRDPETLRREWCTQDEHLAWETWVEGARIGAVVQRGLHRQRLQQLWQLWQLIRTRMYVHGSLPLPAEGITSERLLTKQY